MKTFVSVFVSLLVGLGFGYLVFHNGATPQVKETPLGGEYNINKTQFINGFTAGSTNQFSVSSAGALSSSANVSAATYSTASVGSSSTTPAALSAASAGFFTATTTTQLASSTAVTANSQIFITAMPSSTAFTTLGVTCNPVAPSSTQITAIYPGNGFKVQTNPAPAGATTPYCLAYRILN